MVTVSGRTNVDVWGILLADVIKHKWDGIAVMNMTLRDMYVYAVPVVAELR